MSPKEFAEQLRQLAAALIATRSNETLLTASESLALIRLRIQNLGQDAQGADFGFYSAQYAEQRQEENLQTSFIDLTNTGGMWRETGVFLESENETESTAVIAGRTARAADLLEFNSERYGELLQLSAEEETQVTTAYIERRIGFIQNFLQ